MLVTELAQTKIREIMEAESDLGNVIRVIARRVAPYRFDYELFFIEDEEITGGDLKQDVGGVLFVTDSESAENLEGASIDYVEGPPGGFKFDNPLAKRHFDDPKEAEVNDFIEDVINPKVAAHNGHIALHGIKDGAVYLEMGGSCQGCGMAAMTLRNGVEQQLFGRFPELREIVDVTNHGEGKNPFYARSS